MENAFLLPSSLEGVTGLVVALTACLVALTGLIVALHRLWAGETPTLRPLGRRALDLAKAGRALLDTHGILRSGTSHAGPQRTSRGRHFEPRRRTADRSGDTDAKPPHGTS